MPGLDLGIHHFIARVRPWRMDCRVKPGNDEQKQTRL
jgi:hypothetical protein